MRTRSIGSRMSSTRTHSPESKRSGTHSSQLCAEPAGAMKGSKSHELEADVPASELWKIYGTLRYVQLIHELLPQVLHKVELIRGDGGVGTVIQLTVPPRNPGGAPMSYKEEFAEIDDENRVKVAPVVEGGVLNLGFTSYLTRLEIIEKGPSSSVIRSSVEYEFDDGRPELEAAVRIAPLGVVAEKLVEYVKEQKATEATT